MSATEIPDYIQERILQSVPKKAEIVPNSTPVVAFGDVRKATVATLGFNPSKLEFLTPDGTLLDGDERRLETSISLSRAGVSADPTEAALQVFESCNNYFHRRPYRRWFDVLEKVLKHVGASYYSGSACHLDLVQWATDPVWGQLSQRTKETLLQRDLCFLQKQLSQEHIRLLLLNGAGIVNAHSEYLGHRLEPVRLRPNGRIRMFLGTLNGRVSVIGWNLNLQSSFGVSNAEITRIGTNIARIVSS